MSTQQWKAAVALALATDPCMPGRFAQVPTTWLQSTSTNSEATHGPVARNAERMPCRLRPDVVDAASRHVEARRSARRAPGAEPVFAWVVASRLRPALAQVGVAAVRPKVLLGVGTGRRSGSRPGTARWRGSRSAARRRRPPCVGRRRRSTGRIRARVRADCGGLAVRKRHRDQFRRPGPGRAVALPADVTGSSARRIATPVPPLAQAIWSPRGAARVLRRGGPPSASAVRSPCLASRSAPPGRAAHGRAPGASGRTLRSRSSGAVRRRRSDRRSFARPAGWRNRRCGPR